MKENTPAAAVQWQENLVRSQEHGLNVSFPNNPQQIFFFKGLLMYSTKAPLPKPWWVYLLMEDTLAYTLRSLVEVQSWLLVHKKII